MGSPSPVELLRSVPLFADLEEDELERFSLVAVPRSFPAATRVFHEGDHSDACYIVRSGSFRVTREHSDGRAITLATLGPGDIFGELAMLDGEVRSASVESLERRRAAGAAGGRRPRPARPPPGDHREARRRPGPPPARRQRADLPPVLPDRPQPRRRGPHPARRRRGASGGDGGEVTIRMNQADLAQLAGTSRESVSRFLADLERAGVVRPGRGRVTVLDPAEAPQLHLLVPDHGFAIEPRWTFAELTERIALSTTGGLRCSRRETLPH